jgi:hypothetical protein
MAMQHETMPGPEERRKKNKPCHEEACTTPPCECSCEGLPRERARFFTGRFLTARDLRDEQAYVLSRLRLRNRLFHGWGVVCGLEVKPHPRPECRNWAVVKPGIAIDCCGREIFVCHDRPVELPEPPELPCPEPEPEKPEYPHEHPCGPKRGESGYPEDDRYRREEPEPPDAHYGGEPHQEHPKPCPPDEPEVREWGPYVICLRYVECLIEPGPVLVDEDCCKPGTQSFSRVREGFALEAVPLEQLGEACWPGEDRSDTDCECADEDEADCFAPRCPCGDCVPLALLRWDPRRGVVIDMLGRPRVRTAHESLNRIVGINWSHGRNLAIRDLLDRHCRLEVTFSRPLRRREELPPGVGIGEHTFVVTYSYGSQKDSEFLPFARPPYLDESGCKAIFEIDPDYVGGRNSIERALVHVALKGDFLPDGHGNPVDANHFNGLLPSGNGVAGGTFESWFQVGGAYRSAEERSR